VTTTIESQVIDFSDHHALLAELRQQLPAKPRLGLPAFFEAARQAAERLPEDIRIRLESFRACGSSSGYLLLTNLPVDAKLPATPISAPAPIDRPLLAAEAWLAIVGRTLGLPTGYRELNFGTLYHDVYPVPSAPYPFSATSKTRLRGHTEMAYHVHQPHYVLLGCSRADHEHEAATLVASARKALPLIAPEHRAQLFAEPVPCNVDVWFRGTDPELRHGPAASVFVLSGPADDPQLRYDRELLAPDTPAAAAAVTALTDALDRVAETIRLLPGDLLVVDNYRAARACTSFPARWDGTDRWLHRLFVRDAERIYGPGKPGDVVRFLPRRTHP
jgi:clavaminate synthase/L-asparagine oxygenase